MVSLIFKIILLLGMAVGLIATFIFLWLGDINWAIFCGVYFTFNSLTYATNNIEEKLDKLLEERE